MKRQSLQQTGQQKSGKNSQKGRLKLLLDSDSEDDEDKFNAKALVGENLIDFLSRIENHVKAEQKILDAWNDKDESLPIKK